MLMKCNKHESVLLDQAVNCLNIREDGIYIDCTFSCGGHSRLILSKLGEKGRLIAIDRDPQAFKEAQSITDPRFSMIYGPFSRLGSYAKESNLIGRIDGILFDLGISSAQLDNPQRGFSFMRDGPLDMRMDPSQGLSAAQWLLKASTDEIAWVLKTFGEERFAKRLAHAIFKRNKKNPMNRTKELADLIVDILPIKEKYKHPATRSFQAIRIYINSELEEITRALDASISILSPKGRISVISFHSLEDRIVKNFIRQHSRGLLIPTSIPLTEKQLRLIRNTNLKSIGRIIPSEKEVAENTRARSAVLRFAERIAI